MQANAQSPLKLRYKRRLYKCAKRRINEATFTAEIFLLEIKNYYAFLTSLNCQRVLTVKLPGTRYTIKYSSDHRKYCLTLFQYKKYLDFKLH